MAQDDVLAGPARVLAALTGADLAEVTPNRRFADDLGIDSLTMVDVVVAAEDRSGVLAPDNVARFETVGDVVGHIERTATVVRP
ncbi:acyl carrier protein [Pseudonocardia sp. H11422]|uniref:acyl carrier protein n=1 Tax=Pseudonocardia sp. H11422 TaxID=2835866 RepID=UPI001BDD7952|nr:acyl carrier protein [Pseudonocardia sp. H11422]